MVEQAEEGRTRMDHFSSDFLARERITDMRREAHDARLARTKAQGADSQPRPSMTGLRRIVARLSFIG